MLFKTHDDNPFLFFLKISACKVNNLNYKEHNFFCSHGIFDQVIPIEIGRKSSEMMSKYGINHKFLEFQSSHGICPENFEQMILWLENN